MGRGGLVEGDGGVDGAGPGVDAAGDGLGLCEALLTEPGGDAEGARAVMAEDGDGLVLVEFLVDAAGDVAHGDEGGAFDVRGLELPGLADVEQEGRVGFGEELFELGDGDFVVHG
jgi:hypothetical protein